MWFRKNSIVLVLIVFIVIAFFVLQPQPKYENVRPYRLTANSSKELVTKLINNNEYPKAIELKRVDVKNDIAEIRLINNGTGDDSVIATDTIYKAQEKNGKWTVIEEKRRWKCRGIFEFWGTSICS